VVAIVVADAANAGEQLRRLRHTRQVFADADAGRRRRERLKRAANLARRVGLRVPGVELTLTTAGVDQDDRLRLAKASS